MKKWLIPCMLAAALLLPVCAMGDGAVLMVELPENAQMVENIAFEDGDFIQTYQLGEGVTVQILRYAAFDMSLEELIEGEWAGYENAEMLAISDIGGYPAQGICLTHAESEEKVTAYLVMVEAQGQKLIFEAVFPGDMAEENIRTLMDSWLQTMDVYDPNEAEVG